MKIFLALGAALMCHAACAAPADLKAELLRMKAEDQTAIRLGSAQSDPVINANTVRLKQIVREGGWPRLSVVGEEASQGAWLIVQHADNDRAWQREALALMEPLVETDEIKGTNIAYLRDRLLVADNKPLLYGTQGRCVATGKWEPFPMFEPENVDARRATLKMPPLAEYVAMANRYNRCKVAQ